MKHIIIKKLKILFYKVEPFIITFLQLIFKPKITNAKEIPIIINNFNRLTYLTQLIDALEKRGYHNIHIIDNGSTYKPLLDYYKKTSYTVYFLNKNIGYLALWKTDLYKKFIKDYYVYTDPDVVPIEDCPADFLEYFLTILKRNSQIKKIGFGLKIDDLPDHYKHKESVINWEKQYYLNKSKGENLFVAQIDTTFALYRPWAWGGANIRYQHLRTGFPYLARHLPWYEDSSTPGTENLFYINAATASTHWTSQK